MKTEHRHELKENDLSKVAVKVETFYERHAASLQWGIIGIAFLLACGIYYWRTTAAVDAAAWNELSQSQSAEDFAQVSSDFSGSKAANWAKLREANSYLETGLRDAFENREKANTDLKKARDILTELSKVGGPVELRQQVLFANARALEMTSDGDLQPAITAYETLLKEIPETAFKQEAERRIKSLSKPGAKEFYAFFSKQNPKPPEPPKPNDTKAGGKAASGDPLKPLTSGLQEIQDGALKTGDAGVPVLSPPKLPDVFDSKDDKPAADAPQDGKPAGEAEPKSEEKPATEPKAEEKPAAEPKTEEKPAAEPKPEEKSEEKPAAEPEKKAEEKPADEAPKEPAAKPSEAPAETPAEKKPE